MTLPQQTANTKKNILLAALVAAAGTIPLLVNFNSIALIFFVFACAIQQPWAVLKQKLSDPSLWMIPAVYFLWMCCSYFWDTAGGFSIKDIERYAMLLFIPPALAVIPRMPQKFLKITGAVFIAVVVFVCISCLVKSYDEYRETADTRVFFYHYLSQQMGLNAIFLSNYCLAGIIWMLYYAFVQEEKRKGYAYAIVIMACIFLFSMILLLSSKLIISLTLTLLLFFILYVGYIGRYFVRALLVVVLFIAVALVSIKNLGYVNWRMSTTSAKKYSGPGDNNNGLSIRMLMWQNAWDLVKQKPLLGYGVRGSRVKVVEKYKEENFQLGYKEGYHSHDQYLQTTLMGGIPAFLLLMAMLLKMGYEGIRKNNVLLVLLLFHFMCQSVIESTFEVQQELVFYMLFLFLFYYHPILSPPSSLYTSTPPLSASAQRRVDDN